MLKQAALLLAATAVLAGCATTVDGTPAVGRVPATRAARPTSLTALAAAARHTLMSARGFHALGAVKDHGHSIGYDMHFGDNGSDGAVTLDGYRVRIREIGRTLYVNADARFWRHAAAEAGASSSDATLAVNMYAGRWGRTSVSSKGFADLGTMADRARFLEDSPGDQGKLASGRTATIRGIRVKGIVDTHDHSVLWIRATGAPVPVQITQPGQGKVAITDYDRPFHVPAPPADQVVTLPS